MKFKVGLSIGLITKREDVIEIDDEDLEGCLGTDRQAVIDEYVKEWADQYVEYWGEPVEE